MNPASRVQVLDTPVQHPGICCLCGSAGDGKRKFIDFGKQLDWYGAVYFCTECIREVAEASDYIPVANFNALYEEYRKVQIELDQLKRWYGKIDDAISGLYSNNTSNIDRFANSSSLPLDAVSKSEVPYGATTDAGEGSTESDPLGSVEGPDDVFDVEDFE